MGLGMHPVFTDADIPSYANHELKEDKPYEIHRKPLPLECKWI